MDAYVLIGGQHSYKSSVIRSLSGSRVSGVRQYVLLSNKLINVYVHLLSLQEGVGITPVEFVKRVQSENAAAVLFALRPAKRATFPDADSYLQFFISSGWIIRKVAVLNATANPLHITKLHNNYLKLFPFGPQAITVNSLAADVRSHFGWV